MTDLIAVKTKLHSLVLFRQLLKKPVIAKLLTLLDNISADETTVLDCYCDFVYELYNAGGNLSDYLLQAVLQDENIVVLTVAKGNPLTETLTKCLVNELTSLNELSALTANDVKATIHCNAVLPNWENTPHNITAMYNERLAEIPTKGYGIFAQYHMFTLDNDGNLLPVKNPDPQRLSSLTGYQEQRKKVLTNTLALLDGLEANNILLYGDAGTGKSSTVKAIVNEYHAQGLRLIELKKNQLYHIPELLDTLAQNPLKFILFIDDLSFSSNDNDFTALKAILEGSVAARQGNIVVYATSNRRHLVKESFDERNGNEIHLNDTLEETASLSARFGLTITFLKPDKNLYCTIVEQLALEYKLTTPLPALIELAESHAIRSGGRSPRVAKQFVQFIKAEEISR